MHVILENGATEDFSVEGAVLSIAGLDLDLAEMQSDVERRIIVWSSGGLARASDHDSYRAVVVLPPVVIEEHPGEEEDEIELVALPLDMEAVELKVWPEIQQESE